MDPGEFYSSAADEILSQAMQIPENAGLDYYTLLAEQDIPDPGICRSDATVVPHQQESHQPTQQMLVQQIARHCQALQAFCAGGNPNSEDYFPQMQIYIQRQIESLQSLGIYADVSAQGPHTSSLPRQQIYDGTAEPAEPAEHDDEKEARGEAPPNGKRYRCKDPRCSQKPQVFTLHATFGRHIETQHHPRVIYNCPVPCGCRQKFTRRDKVGAHCRAAHLTDPNTVNIDGNKVNIQCPAICALCPRVVRSWSAFYKCFMSHCVIEDEPVDNHQQTPHHDGSGNGGAGSAHGNESNASASKTGGARGTMSNEGFGGNAGHSQGRGFQSRQYNGNQMDPNQPTALDNPSFPGEADFLASPQPYPTSSIPEQRRGSTDQVPPGTLPRGQTFRPPPRQQPPPTETLLYEQLRCQRCPHFFSSCDPNCTLLTRTDGCHACDAGIALTTDMASIARGLGSHRQPYLPGRRAQTLRNSGLQMTGRGTPEHGVRQIRQLRHQIQDYRSGGSQRTGGSTGAMFVTEITEPDFSEHELLKPSGLNATKAESTALWLPIRSLPKSVAKILQPESSELDGMYSQLQFMLSVAFQFCSIANNFIRRRPRPG